MEQTVPASQPQPIHYSPSEAWKSVKVSLEQSMNRNQFTTWVAPLQLLGVENGLLKLSANNAFARDWVISHLDKRIAKEFGGLVGYPVRLNVQVGGAAPEKEAVEEEEQDEEEAAPQKGKKAITTNRKLALEQAYGSQRAAVIKPERVMVMTNYLMDHWTPLIGHTAVFIILSARSLCFWDPRTGELRNIVHLTISDLAKKAHVSVRTIKDVLNQDLIKKYFLRYKIERVSTPNGVRTKGIILQVRMDDPLTPEHQALYSLPENQRWYSSEFELFDDDEE